MLTHDPKLDDPALRTALPSAAFYVGALGSQKTQGRRRQRLLEAGLTESQLDRLHAPIGLDLGGRSPEEIALAVMAEIVAARNGRSRSRDASRRDGERERAPGRDRRGRVIVGLVLAAGASRRLGRNKLLLPFRGGTVLSTTVARLLASILDRVIVVLGYAEGEVRSRAGLSEDPRLAIVANPGWEEGMASSLRRGVEAAAEAEAVIVALGDQPDTDPEVVGRLVTAFRGGATLAVPVHGGPAETGIDERATAETGIESTGHPVLFARALFPELLALRGDKGARDVVKRHWSEAVKVAAVPLHDVDTEDDYRALLEREPRR